MSDEIRQLQQAVQTEDDALYSDRNRLRAQQNRLSRVRRAGEAETSTAELERAIAELQQTIAGRRDALAELRRHLAELTAELVLPKTPNQLAGELDDEIPILLLPVRIETRFMRIDSGVELWVRVFPDDIAVDSHEQTLTQDEAMAGVAYWSEIHRLTDQTVAEETVGRKKAAWRMLAEPFGAGRAAWIMKVLERAIREKHPDFDLSFLATPSEPQQVLRELGFDPDAFKAES